MEEEYRTAISFLEPVRVPTTFDTDDHFPLQLAVEPGYVINFMVQHNLIGHAILGVQVTQCLLARVNVYSDI
jgi:hypothetical protein